MLEQVGFKRSTPGELVEVGPTRRLVRTFPTPYFLGINNPSIPHFFHLQSTHSPHTTYALSVYRILIFCWSFEGFSWSFGGLVIKKLNILSKIVCFGSSRGNILAFLISITHATGRSAVETCSAVGPPLSSTIKSLLLVGLEDWPITTTAGVACLLPPFLFLPSPFDPSPL